MSSSAKELEQATLASLRKDFEARGYRFVSQPSKDDTPSFLQDYRPDALAIGDQDRVIIEVKAREARTNKVALAEIARRIPHDEGWRYMVVYVGQDSSELVDLPRPSKSQVGHAIDEARELAGTDHSRAAMLQSWSILEALARRIYPDDITIALKPLTPNEIVERLSMEGELDVHDSKRIRSLRSLRTSLAHGDLETKVSKEDVDYILALAERINAHVSP